MSKEPPIEKIDIRRELEVPLISLGTELIPARTCVFMKVGSHGNEDFQEIIERKIKEQETAGFMLWGYSGILLKAKPVADFLKSRWGLGERLLLLMVETSSPFKNSPVESTAFSIDGHTWYHLPEGVATRGCNKAIVCDKLTEVDISVDLSLYKIAVGPSSGKALSSYLRYRTDKACAIFSGPSLDIPVNWAVINWVAEIVPPFALYLNNKTNVQASLFTPPTDESLGFLAKTH